MCVRVCVMEEEEKVNIQTPSIKLIRNTKGYFFEIKILSLDVLELERVRNDLVAKTSLWMQKEA